MKASARSLGRIAVVSAFLLVLAVPPYAMGPEGTGEKGGNTRIIDHTTYFDANKLLM